MNNSKTFAVSPSSLERPALYHRISRNLRGRDVICGDVHGTVTGLRAALVAIDFAPDAGDRLFIPGDLVDRGPESLEAVELLDQPWLFATRGNHEQMAIDYAAGQMDAELYHMNGGAWFTHLTRAEQMAIADTFSALPIAIELETEHGPVGLVHAACPFDRFGELEQHLGGAGLRSDAVTNYCLWSRDRIGEGHDGTVHDVRAVVVGHTPMDRWTTLGNHIYIDTMGWRGRKFTLLDAATLQPIRQRDGAATS